MRIAELRVKTSDELVKQLTEFKKELMNLRFSKMSGSLTKTSRVRDVRRSIARISTLLNSKPSGSK